MVKLKIVTDVDGVLLDDVDFKLRGAWLETFADSKKSQKHFLDIIKTQEGLKLNRYGIIQKVLTRLGRRDLAGLGVEEIQTHPDIQKIASRFSEISITGVVQRGCFIGVPETLKILQSSGRRLYAVSGTKDSDLQVILEHVGILKYFVKSIGFKPSSGGVVGKKANFIEVMILENDQDASHYLYVGDLYADYEAASEAGMHFVGIANSNNAWNDKEDIPFRTISSFTELPKFLSEIET